MLGEWLGFRVILRAKAQFSLHVEGVPESAACRSAARARSVRSVADRCSAVETLHLHHTMTSSQGRLPTHQTPGKTSVRDDSRNAGVTSWPNSTLRSSFADSSSSVAETLPPLASLGNSGHRTPAHPFFFRRISPGLGNAQRSRGQGRPTLKAWRRTPGSTATTTTDVRFHVVKIFVLFPRQASEVGFWGATYLPARAG